MAHLRTNHGVNEWREGKEVVVEGTPAKKLTCLVEGCVAEFVSKGTRDRHLRTQHGPEAEPAKKGAKDRPKKKGSRPRKDLARDLAGLHDRVEICVNKIADASPEDSVVCVEDAAKDSFILRSLNLPTRYDNITVSPM